MYATLFLPLATGILPSLVCQIEHLMGGWKQLLTLPMGRTSVYVVKLPYLLIFLALMQGLVLVGILVDGSAFLHITCHGDGKLDT